MKNTKIIVAKNLEVLLKKKHPTHAKRVIEIINGLIKDKKFPNLDEKLDFIIEYLNLYIENPNRLLIQYLN